MDESVVNDILDKVHSQFTAYDQKLQEISQKVQSGLEAINEGVSLKLAALKDRLTGNAVIPEDFTGQSETEQANLPHEQNTEENHSTEEEVTDDPALVSEDNEDNSEENSFEPFKPLEIIETKGEKENVVSPTGQAIIKAALDKIEKIKKKEKGKS